MLPQLRFLLSEKKTDKLVLISFLAIMFSFTLI